MTGLDRPTHSKEWEDDLGKLAYEHAYNCLCFFSEIEHELSNFTGRSTYVERYLIGESKLHIHLFRGMLRGNADGCCAVLGNPIQVDIDAGRRLGSLPLDQGGDDWKDKMMLVRDVQIVEKPQPGPFRLLAEIEGLYRLNECPHVIAYAADLRTGQAYKFFSVFEDGEFGGTTGLPLSIYQDKLPDKPVQSAAKVVKDLPDDDAPNDLVWQRIEEDARSILGSILVSLSRVSVLVTCDKSINRFSEDVGLFFSPADLFLDPAKRLRPVLKVPVRLAAHG